MTDDWQTAIETYNNPFKVSFDEQGRCVACGMFHNIDNGLEEIADCDGKFQNKEDVKEEVPTDEIETSGVAENVKSWPPKKEGRDPMYTFTLGETKFSGFAKIPPFKDGDEVKFRYKKNGQYNNVKYVCEVNDYSTEPTTADKITYKEEIKSVKPSDREFTISCMGLMNAVVKLCIERKDLGDKQIEVAFERYLKLSGAFDTWKKLNEKGGTNEN